MNSKINQDDVNKAVWAACDTFRGTVDPSIYKDFILTNTFATKPLFSRYESALVWEFSQIATQY